MQQKRGKFNPLSNRVTSKVFFALFENEKTPSAIAKSFGRAPASIIEHLRRLQKIGIVRAGKKTGRERRYKICWNQFVGIFIKECFSMERAVWLGLIDYKIAIDKGEQAYYRVVSTRIKELTQKLRNNKKFSELLENYYSNLTPYEYDFTIMATIDGFLDALVLKGEGLEKQQDPEKEELRPLLEKLRDSIKGVDTLPASALKSALRDMKMIGVKKIDVHSKPTSNHTFHHGLQLRSNKK